MEAERNILIEAWRICSQGISKDKTQYNNAYEYIENFKKTSHFILDIGFEFAFSTESFELAHFGLHLITNVIKFKWNDLDPSFKLVIKNKLIELITNLDSRGDVKKSTQYFRNNLCLTFLELVKREWPQNWPTLLSELCEISNKSFEQRDLVLTIFKYIAEEFIVNENPTIPMQRRKDIIQFLNANMEFVYKLFLDCLEETYAAIQNIQNTELVEKNVLLARSCIGCLINYVDWININLIFSKDFRLITITLSLLHHKELCIDAAKCLISILSRKGALSERKPMINILNEHLLSKIYECFQMSMANTEFKKLLKYLVQILIAVGTQLNSLWVDEKFEPPFDLSCYFNCVFELIVSENRIYSAEAIQLWISIMTNQYIQKNAIVGQATQQLAKIMINSKLMFKMNTDVLMDEFNSEEDFMKFSQKYRTDLTRLIRLATNLYLVEFLGAAFEWANTIIFETRKLAPEDQTGYDTSSFLFLCWDALIFLWTSIMPAINKKIKDKTYADDNEFHFIKDKLLTLTSLCVEFDSTNANFCSYRLSLLSSILTSCEIENDTQKTELILKTIIEKYFTEFIRFQGIFLELPSSTSKNILNSVKNLKRQLAANVLNLCRKFAVQLKNLNEAIYHHSMSIINSETSTQVERVIFIQSLIYCSNESNSYEAQSAFIEQFIAPIHSFFTSADFQSALSNVQVFVKYFGLNSSAVPEAACPLLQTRRQLFYYVNVLYAILNSVRKMEEVEIKNLSNSGFVDLKTNRLKNPAFGSYMKVLEPILAIIKTMNIIHSSEFKSLVLPEYLEMTESAKNMVLGMNTQISSSAINIEVTNESSSDPNHYSDKILMFFYNVYETLNQIIPLYFQKFKNELLLVESSDTSLQFTHKLGDSIFANFNEVPDFRMRQIIRYTLRSALTFNFKSEYIEKEYVIVRMNEILLEYFLPSVLTKINVKIKHFKILKEESKNRAETDSKSENIQNQIIEENQFVLMCRDVVELLRLFLNVSIGSTNKDEASEELNDQMEETSKALENQNPNLIVLSELAIHLLKKNKVIFQATILLLFEGLNWSDSYCCLRLARIAMTLFENISVNNLVDQKKIVFHLNDQIGEQLFRSCLLANQLHGEQQETASLLTNLSFLLYEKFPFSTKEIFNNLIAKIPNINTRLYEDFTKLASSNYNPKDVLKNDKAKKDIFKKLIQPIVGKHVSQLYKNEVEIRQLRPMNLTKTNVDTNTEVTSICSLFDI